jgi:hypothetical protein
MWYPVGLVRTDVLEELIDFIFRATRIAKLGIMLAVSSNRSTLRINSSSPILVTLLIEAIHYSKPLVLTRATWLHIPEDGIFHSLHRENLKSDFEYAARKVYTNLPDDTVLNADDDMKRHRYENQ